MQTELVIMQTLEARPDEAVKSGRLSQKSEPSMASLVDANEDEAKHVLKEKNTMSNASQIQMPRSEVTSQQYIEYKSP